MLELVIFLLARIDEDQQALQYFDDRFGQPRWAAECEVRRRIVHLVAPRPEGGDGLNGAEILRLMALPYAAHPDYRAHWRP